jgi:pilus assembly protein CpaD
LIGRDEDMQMTRTVPPTPRPRRRTLAAWRGLLLAGVAAALAGCQTATPLTTGVSDIPTDYRQRHPIAIKEGERTVEFLIGHARGGLSAAQRADVTAFAHSWRRESTGGIVVDVPAGTPNARATSDALHEVRSILAHSGVPGSAVQVRRYQPADPRIMANLRLNYPRMDASAGPCGVWPDDIGPSFNRNYNENNPYYNFGCANQRNIAAMVENPHDLVQPRGETPIYAGRRAVVLDKYRKGESTATAYPDADKGKISDLGR